MSKVGRNDPCPCGSGKKYKKCCGANNVIEFNPHLYNNELDLLNEELMGFAITNYEPELMKSTENYTLFHLPEGGKDEVDAYLPLLSAWIMVNEPMENGKTIFENFRAKQLNKIKYPRVKKVFSSWDQAQPGVYEIISIDNHQVPQITIQDLDTNQTYQCIAKEETEQDIGNLLIGLLVPYIDAHDFLFGRLEFPNEGEDYILNLLSEIDINEDKLNDVFPEFLANVIQPETENELDWPSPTHEMVAQLFTKHMLEKDMDEMVIQAGILLWNTYCLRHDPIIKKLGAYAAALEYFMHQTFLENHHITQAQMAKEYGTSSGTVSTNFRKLFNEIQALDDAYDLFNMGDYFDGSLDEPSLGQHPTPAPSMERDMREIQKILAEEEFDTLEEANDYINSLLQDGNIPSTPDEPRDMAQDLIYEAMEKEGREQKRLINEALDIYPNSPDAYLLLAEKAATPREYRKLLQQAVTAGEKDLGEAFFKENKGHFWGLVETRPFMRAKAAYAISLEQAGFYEEAIKHYEELLELNPNDNQGIRDLLLPLYIEIGDFDQATKLLHTYEDDITATFTFNKALVCYLTDGVTKRAIRLLKEADEENPYVMDYLLGSKKVPNETFDYIGIGDETEAISYVQENIHLWADAGELLKALVR